MRQGLTRWFAIGLMLAGGSVAAQDKAQPNPDGKPATRSDIGAEYEAAKAYLSESQEQIRQLREKFTEAQRKTHEQLETKVQSKTSGGDASSRPPIRNVKTLSWGDFFAEQYGFDFVEADPVLRSQLSLPEDEGLVVVSVTAGRDADKAGIKEKDLIVKINEKPVANVAQARKLITQADDRMVRVDLYRAGEPVRLTLTKSPGHSFPMSYWIGVPMTPVDATLRSQLPMLPAAAGLIVTDVVADSPAAKAGIQKNDILVRSGDELLTSNEVLIDHIGKSAGKEIKLELLRAGKITSLNVTPEKRGDSRGIYIDFPAGMVLRQGSKYGDQFQFVNPGTNALKGIPTGQDLAREAWEKQVMDRLQEHVRLNDKRKNLASQKNPTSQETGGANARIEQEMRHLSDKIDELRQAIDTLKIPKPAAATSDK